MSSLLPLIGASTNRTPRLSASAARRTASAGLPVTWEASTAPGSMAARRPSGPEASASSCSSE